MDLKGPPKTLVGTIAVTQFPVYGIVGCPLDLTYDSRWVDIGAIPFPAVTSITLSFTSPRYPSYSSEMLVIKTFQVRSAWPQIVSPEEPNSLRDYILQEQGQPVRNPFLWEGSLSIAGTLFQGKIRYYATPLKLSWYHLLSEESFLEGYSYGPSCDELIELLEGLQVLNGRDEVIKQYTSR